LSATDRVCTEERDAPVRLTARERKHVDSIVSDLRDRFGASQVILYGSACRGEMTPESDIDLLAVLPVVDWEIEKQIVDLCFEAELRIGRIVSVLPISENDYRRSPLRSAPIVVNAQREGKAL
jgi:predicted nucleotidyltransferase